MNEGYTVVWLNTDSKWRVIRKTNATTKQTQDMLATVLQVIDNVVSISYCANSAYIMVFDMDGEVTAAIERMYERTRGPDLDAVSIHFPFMFPFMFPFIAEEW